MTEHPCSDHRCYLCDVVGICCSTVSAEQRAKLEAHFDAELDDLRQTVADEAARTPSLADLLLCEAQPASAPRLLEPAPPLPATDLASPNQRKEPIHVVTSTPR